VAVVCSQMALASLLALTYIEELAITAKPLHHRVPREDGRITLERDAGVIIAGRYRLVEKLGSGGMGSVWLADDLSLDSPCAVKLIDSEKSQSEEVRKRFIREAKAAAQLRGPHVVDVFDRGESDGILYIAMEHLEGEDLCTRLGRVGALDLEKSYRIIAHVARALSSAHALGIVHRDLKPENIFLVQSYDEEIAKVLDFGIAQHEAYRLQDRATREGSFLGTPYYVSPEQARGRPTDHRSDLWSLAVITYQCLTGWPPFDSESLGELMGLILYEPIPRITDTNPELPPAVEDWWTRATQRDRELRFQSARELADELGRALGVKSVVKVPTVPPRRQSSYPDEGEYRLVLGSAVPRAPLPSFHESGRAEEVMQAATLNFAAAIGADPLRATDVAVTRTRPSIHSVKQGLEWGLARLRESPRRPLLVITIGVGVVVGAVSILALSMQTPSTTALAPEANASARQPSLVASAPSPPASAADAGAVHATYPEVLPIQVRPVEDVPRVQSPTKRPPAVAPIPRRAPVGTPDYGI
jgi:serine/threonine protein kinase